MLLDKYYGMETIDNIVRIIEDENLIDEKEIIFGYEDFFTKLIQREKEWNIKISDFIADNLSKTQLFYDPNHPTNTIISEVIKRLLNYMGILESNISFQTLTHLDNFEIPIYNSVRKALKLKYKKIILREYSRHSLSNVQMDIEEYVKQYFMWKYKLN